jgi:hypothetical protein
VCFQGFVAKCGQQVHHELQVRRIVFDYEYASRGTSSRAGIEMVKRLPFPYSLSKDTRPPIMLGQLLTDMEAQPGMRHANSRITLDTYTQALTPANRQAQTNVVSMILPRREEETDSSYCSFLFPRPKAKLTQNSGRARGISCRTSRLLRTNPAVEVG